MSIRITLNPKEIGLLLEGIDMIRADWSGSGEREEHPEEDELRKLEKRLINLKHKVENKS